MLPTLTLSLAIVLAPAVALGGEADVSPALRAQAEAVCMDDALRLCPASITDEATVVACMRPKRAKLTMPCRKVFDEVVQEVRR